jgi:hypothetical protein
VVYSGAIPIFIDDVTDPFGVCVPSLRVLSSDYIPAQFAHWLHAQIKAAEISGASWQQQLALVLKTRLDYPRLSAHHTFVGQIVATALRHWQGEQGFGKRVALLG